MPAAKKKGGAASAAPLVKVRILPHRSVRLDDRGELRTFTAHEECAVSKQDADTLVNEGYAELVTSTGRRGVKPLPGTDKTGYFSAGEREEHDSSGRRKLTPVSIEDGTEERGR